MLVSMLLAVPCALMWRALYRGVRYGAPVRPR